MKRKLQFLVTMSVAILMLLATFSTASAASGTGTYAIEPDPGGGSINGAFIKSNYGKSGYSMTIEDYFMRPGDARTFASKLDVSGTETVSWLATGFLPGIGPYLTLLGTSSTYYRGSIASKIRSYTNNNQSVHVTSFKDNYGKYYAVEYWNGYGSSVDPYEAPQPAYQTITARYWK
jgi:hypothetical protein